MNPEPMAAALRNHAARLRQINVQTEADSALLRDCADLLRVFASTLTDKGAIQAFGPPGDWGYGTELGKAVIELRAGTCAGQRDRKPVQRPLPVAAAPHGAVIVNGAVALCEANDREPCPTDPARRCVACPGGSVVAAPGGAANG